MEVLLTTTGLVSQIELPELGNRIFVHPTTNFDLLQEFKVEEIRGSTSIYDALDNGWITIEDEYGRAVNVDNLWQLDDNQGLIDVLNIEGIEGLSGGSINAFSQDILVYDLFLDNHIKLNLGNVLNQAPNFSNTNLLLGNNRVHDLNSNNLLISESGFLKNGPYLELFQDTSQPTRMGAILGWSNESKVATLGGNIRFETQDGTSPGPSLKMLIDENGDVGIGYTNPNNKLTINGRLTVGTNDTMVNDTIAEFSSESITTNATARVNIRTSEDNGVNPSTAMIQFLSSTSQTGSLTPRRGIVGFWGGRMTIHSGTNPSNTGIAFSTNDVNASNNIRMLITQNEGDIGINTNTPTAKLHVRGSGNTSGQTALRVTNLSNNDILTALGNQRVGINVNTPQSTLHVNGDIKYTDAEIRASSSITTTNNTATTIKSIGLPTGCVVRLIVTILGQRQGIDSTWHSQQSHITVTVPTGFGVSPQQRGIGNLYLHRNSTSTNVSYSYNITQFFTPNIDIRVQGISGQNWDWRCDVEYRILQTSAI